MKNAALFRPITCVFVAAFMLVLFSQCKSKKKLADERPNEQAEVISNVEPASESSETNTEVDLWIEVNEATLNLEKTRPAYPSEFLLFELKLEEMKQQLNRAAADRDFGASVTLPLPDGRFIAFAIEDSGVMAPELAAKYPEIKSYKGEDVSKSGITTRIDLNDKGFTAMILDGGNTYLISPYSEGNTKHYMSYNKNDLPDIDKGQYFKEDHNKR